MAEQTISKNRISQIRSLHQKKFREEERRFIVEGVKVVDELLASAYRVETIVCTASYFERNASRLEHISEVLLAKEQDLERVSALTTPQEILAVAGIPSNDLKVDALKGKLSILLDDVRDPGNLGTILRVAHWFGAGQVITSLNSVDAYNPKVVQASMGSLFHVPVHAIGLEGLLSDVKAQTEIPVYSTVLGGKNLYQTTLTSEGLLIFGNESMGVRTSLMELSNELLTIPSFEQISGNRPESLNVGVSVAVVMAEFRRRG